MLDASASPEVVSKTWGQRDVVTTNVEAPPHLRVLAAVDAPRSATKLLPGRHPEAGDALTAARNIYGVRNVAARMGALWGHRSWGLCASKKVKEALLKDWAPLPSMVPVHYGALRGLDHLKHADAMLVVGREEPRVDAVDGLVAALTYDDPEPETPFDALGTGLDDAGAVLRSGGDYKSERVISMRDGSDVTIRAARYPGRWAGIVQAQIREEEILQAIGRLRPVYREGTAPLVVLLTSVVPEGLVVDELCHIDDLRHDAQAYEAARIAGALDVAAAVLTLGTGAREDARNAAREAKTSRMGDAFVHVENERVDAGPYVTLVSPHVADPATLSEGVGLGHPPARHRCRHHNRRGTTMWVIGSFAGYLQMTDRGSRMSAPWKDARAGWSKTS